MNSDSECGVRKFYFRGNATRSMQNLKLGFLAEGQEGNDGASVVRVEEKAVEGTTLTAPVPTWF